MRILIAPDSFKGTLAAREVGEIIARHALADLPGSTVEIVPMADGGEGTLEAVACLREGTLRSVRVHDPLLRPLDAPYLVFGDTAVIEMAQASGMTLLDEDERDASKTSSFGTGELIRDAIQNGYRKILIGLGGSATNDGGAGALSALGVRFLDDSAEVFIPTGGTLEDISDIDISGLITMSRGCHVRALCDVDVPLLGPEGATRMFGLQKGAGAEELDEIETGMCRYAELVGQATGQDRDCDPYAYPGAGAAGGMGYALHAFLGVDLTSGVDAIMDLAGMEERIAAADIVITGEGCFDRQSTRGKVVWGIAHAAKRAGKSCYVIAGSVSEGILADFGTVSDGLGALGDPDELFGGEDLIDAHLFDGIEVAADHTMTLGYAMSHAATLLGDAADRLFDGTVGR